MFVLQKPRTRNFVKLFYIYFLNLTYFFVHIVTAIDCIFSMQNYLDLALSDLPTLMALKPLSKSKRCQKTVCIKWDARF